MTLSVARESSSTETSDDAVSQPQVQCPHCDRTFTGTVNLGGHISKKHPGMSDKYKAKTTRREELADLRAMRAKAKTIIFELTGKPYPTSKRGHVTKLVKLYLDESREKQAHVKEEIQQKIEE